MPKDWIEQATDNLRQQATASTRGVATGTLRFGRIWAESDRPSTDEAAFWDVVLLDDLYAEIDLSAARAYGNGSGRAVRPVVRNVPAPLVMSLAEDDLVVLRLSPGASAGYLPGSYEVTEEDYDLATVNTGEGSGIISNMTGGGGGCGGSLLRD